MPTVLPRSDVSCLLNYRNINRTRLDEHTTSRCMQRFACCGGTKKTDMRTTGPRTGHRSDPLGFRPQAGFALAIVAAFAAGSGLIVPLPAGLAMPVLASLFLAFAAVFGAIAWRNGSQDPARVTYADVAGALTLIGLFAAATIEPDQLAMLVADHGAARE